MFQYLRACRVGSWFGWLFCFGLGVIILEFPRLEHAVITFIAFLLITACIFILNQYFDRNVDQENMVKADLPIASGRITPQRALILSFSLITLGLTLVFTIDLYLFLLFLIYLGLWTAYSAPPFRLKAVPGVDFIVSGLGAGLLPFCMGLGVSHQLSGNVSTIMLVAIPLMLIHSGGHIIQAVGDYEADCKMGIHTFAVKYGKKRGSIVAGCMILIAALLPIVYAALSFFSFIHLLLLFILFPLSIPVAMRYACALNNPSTQCVDSLQKTARKFGAIVLAAIWVYVLLIKIAVF